MQFLAVAKISALEGEEMLGTKKLFLDYCIFAFTIKTITCTIIKLTGEKAFKAFPYYCSLRHE